MEEGENISQQTEPAREAPSQIERKDDQGSSVPERKGKKKFPVKLVAIVLGLLIVVGGGGWFLLKEPSVESEKVDDSALEAPEFRQPTSTPIPTQKEVERSDISIQVLNGTGIEREATYLKEQLEGLGYVEIEVGNAEKQENETTQVTFSSQIEEEIVDEITQELKTIYKSVKTKTSDSEEDYNVVVITGLRKGQSLPTETPVPSPTPTADETPTPTGSVSATPTP